MCIISSFMCVTCPLKEVLPGIDKGQDVPIGLLVSSQWNGGGCELSGRKGPEMQILYVKEL